MTSEPEVTSMRKTSKSTPIINKGKWEFDPDKGLVFHGDMTWDEYNQCGIEAKTAYDYGRWALIKWWEEGQRLGFGERVYQATIFEDAGLSKDFEEQLLVVSRHVPPANRDIPVSMSHYRKVARTALSADPSTQRNLLEKAHRENLTSDELDREVRKVTAEPDAPAPKIDRPLNIRIGVSKPRQSVAQWKANALQRCSEMIDEHIKKCRERQTPEQLIEKAKELSRKEAAKDQKAPKKVAKKKR